MTSTNADNVALTVTVRWCHDVIAVRHLTGTSSAIAGDLPSSMAPIPCDTIKAPGWAFATLTAGRARVSIPAGMVASRRSSSSSDVELIAGPADVPLLRTETIELRMGAFQLTAEAVAPD